TCRQGLAGSRGPRARREQPVVSLARSGAEAQTGHRDIDPARVAESCSQRSHRGRWGIIGVRGDYWCQGIIGVRGLLVSVLFSPKKELTPIISHASRLEAKPSTSKWR